MVKLVALPQPSEDGNRVVHRWLVHQNLLEAPLQGRVLLDVLAVLIQGGRADATQLPTAEHRLEQVAGVHSPVCGAGSNHGVDLVDEEDDATVGVCHLIDNSLEAVLELASELSSSDEGTHVESHQRAVLEGRRHITSDDPLRKALSHGRFTNARLADQYGVVLCATGKDLDCPADLIVPADHGVQLPVLGGLCEVPCILAEGLVLALRVLV
mmetsp:Transcript_3709/g.10722  ORF Transcript_3709/g.10722 Transcript_3709/m.10722 type:complete len:212 (-) Transcript_3709:1075-1710(-)